MTFLFSLLLYNDVHLLQGEDEEADAEEEDDDGWMVPHGYLSEGEGCEDDEEVKF